ncbi:unnamed protein product [Periconia digitata]|uniref:YeeE/YedE family integral membrane protein n=1 Tax=Periconia digitata TaxID=1303443 RepID=A0A9W4XE76_9PLEO|nr:unnamed protein product [Periconia digitata]
MFTPLESTLGAFLLHQSTSLLLHNNGLVLGCSGFLRNLLSTSPSPTTITFVLGMATSVPVLKLLLPSILTSYPAAPSSLQSAFVTAGIGALVGWGTKASNGCTSGHMLCGLSRLSARSAVAVALFFPAAILTHHLAHPSLLTQECAGDIPCYTPVYPPREEALSLVAFTVLAILLSRALPRIVARFPASSPPTPPPSSSSSSTSPAARKQISPTHTPSLPNLTTTFLSGLNFALGLQISQMSSPAKVSSFLSFPSLHNWDPSLALILVFGVLPNYLDNYFRGHPYAADDATSSSATAAAAAAAAGEKNKTKTPKFANSYQVSNKTLRDGDWRFVVGAVVFGVGWGLTGTCPGPALVRGVVQPQWGALWMGGFWVGGLF